MKTLFTLEFWVGVQFFIELVLVGVILNMMKRFKQEKNFFLSGSSDPLMSEEAVSQKVLEIMDQLEPLIRESEVTAELFEESIKEKKQLIKGLNEGVDAKITSLNLLLSQVEAAEVESTRFQSSARGKEPTSTSPRSMVQESDFFTEQLEKSIQEKKRLITGLNDTLDSKIISLNLLLSRLDASRGISNLEVVTAPSTLMPSSVQPPSSENLYSTPPAPTPTTPSASGDVFDQQNRILTLLDQGMGTDDIAARLSMPKGEVQLVVDLKKKFVKMERSG